ncbi:hypothetical protein BREVNS_0907 [Brevinematales bacterium NS]|nr:hypothetical protein BREVNS_0907 [Brevinematales bacterium NS]
MLKRVWIVGFFLCSLLAYGRFSVGVDVNGITWWPGIFVFDMGNNWAQASVGPVTTLAYGGHGEYALDDTLSLFGRVLFSPAGEDTLYFGEFNIRWYGDTPAPEGVSVGAGLFYFQVRQFVGFYPQVLASYKWLLGKHFYLEPEVTVFPLFADMYLGLRFSVGAGFLF